MHAESSEFIEAQPRMRAARALDEPASLLGASDFAGLKVQGLRLWGLEFNFCWLDLFLSRESHQTRSLPRALQALGFRVPGLRLRVQDLGYSTV